MSSKIYMIEGGVALDLVKKHIAEVRRVREDINVLCKELGPSASPQTSLTVV